MARSSGIVLRTLRYETPQPAVRVKPAEILPLLNETTAHFVGSLMFMHGKGESVVRVSFEDGGKHTIETSAKDKGRFYLSVNDQHGVPDSHYTTEAKDIGKFLTKVMATAKRNKKFQDFLKTHTEIKETILAAARDYRELDGAIRELSGKI